MSFGESGDVAGGVPDGVMEARPRGISWPTVGVSVVSSCVAAALVLGFGVQLSQGKWEQAAAQGAAMTQPAELSVPASSDSAAPAAAATTAPTTAASAASPSVAQDAPAVALEPAPQENQAADPAPEQAVDETVEDPNTGWYPSGDFSASFAATNPEPTLDDLNGVLHALVATPGSDADKAHNLEAGLPGTVVPRTIYNLGIFRPPLGWKRISGPLTVEGNTASATLNASSAGRPTISLRVEFRYLDGRWKLATNSLRNGIDAVGLPIAGAF
ncbi:hypothetical protein ACL1KS_03330 [Corynebacterium striatum]